MDDLEAAQVERDALVDGIRPIVEKCRELNADERREFMAVVEQAADDAYYEVFETYRARTRSRWKPHPDALSYEQRGLPADRRARV